MHHCKKEKKKIGYTTVPQKSLKKSRKHLSILSACYLTQALFEISISGQLILWFSVIYYLRVFGVHHAIEAVGFYNGPSSPRIDLCGMPDVNS